MFDNFKEKMRRNREARDQADRARQSEAGRAEAAAKERIRRIQAVRVITGDVKYSYAIIDTLHAVGHYEAYSGQLIDPEESTRRAVEQLQQKAFRLGADAVIHAQYHIVRYTIQRRQLLFTPAYETHVFGTAVKILGPPPDWRRADDPKTADG